MTTAHPLAWPDGWPRTPPAKQTKSRFSVTPDRARKLLLAELHSLGATGIVISSNVPLRADGQPSARRTIIHDPGVAVYFRLHGASQVMARDLYWTAWENLHEIGHAIKAMRMLALHGGDFMLKRAFMGFTALPPPGVSHWSDVLGVPRTASRDDIDAAYRRLARERHPDAGGSSDAMAALNIARERALKDRPLTGPPTP